MGKTPPPYVIEPVVQKDTGDCAIACLAMILGVPYVNVSVAAQALTRKPGQTGLHTRDMQTIARSLGRKLTSVRVPSINLDEETGILFVELGQPLEHAVVLFQGVVFNPADGLIYDPTTYLATSQARVTGFLRA